MITELSFKFSGRYGNNILSLINAIHIHKKNQNSYLLIPNTRSKTIKPQLIDLHHLKESNFLDYIFLDHKNNQSQKIKKEKIHNVYWIGYNNYRSKDYSTFEEKISYIPIITKILNINDKKYILDNDLLIHIRSGDIYKKNAHKSYSQPPLSFYHKVINSHNFSNIHIITDNNKNFVAQELKNNYQDKLSIIHENNVPEAFNMIRNAKNICTSTSSFCAMAILTKPSDLIKNIYTYPFLITEHIWGFNRLFDNNLNKKSFNFKIYDIQNYLFMSKKKDTSFVNQQNIYNRNWKYNQSTIDLMLSHSIDEIIEIC